MLDNKSIYEAMTIKPDNEYPEYPCFKEGIRRAPDRGFRLTKEQTKIALKNALRYVPEELHSKLAPEFMEELKTRGRIYAYRYRPEGRIYGKPINEYKGKCLAGKAFQVMIENNLDFEVALYPYELVTYGETGQVCQNWLQYRLIKKYLEENFVYTESVEKIKHGESALESFFISGKGYDVHFATAAVMLFRYYGIPARYVEGYLVTPEDASMMQKNVAYELPRENAHAWAEIYIDGIGFVPIEVSPKYKNIMEEANDSAKENNLSSGDDDFHDMNIITIIFTIIAAVLLLLLAAVLVKMLALSIAELIKRRRLFMRSDPKRAISAIYGFMEEKNYPMLAESRALGNKAAYSIYPMEENDRKIMLGYLKKAKKEKHRNEYKNKYRKEKH